METVALVILLLLALALIGVVLLQRNEGGGLGMGAGGVMTGRAQATALARATWWLGGAFLATSLALTVIAARDASETSVVDRLAPAAGADEPAEEGSAFPDLGEGGSLLPPPAGGAGTDDAPLVPTGD